MKRASRRVLAAESALGGGKGLRQIVGAIEPFRAGEIGRGEIALVAAVLRRLGDRVFERLHRVVVVAEDEVRET